MTEFKSNYIHRGPLNYYDPVVMEFLELFGINEWPKKPIYISSNDLKSVNLIDEFNERDLQKRLKELLSLAVYYKLREPINKLEGLISLLRTLCKRKGYVFLTNLRGGIRVYTLIPPTLTRLYIHV